MSMYGRITDLQLWDRILEEKEMESITGCEDIKEGNLLNMATSNWILNNMFNSSEKEMVDLESEVCSKSQKSIHLVPYKLSLKPHGMDMCNKLSGRMAGYSTKEEYENIVQFMSKANHQKTKHCVVKGKNTFESFIMSAWLANDDDDVEGEFRDVYSGKAVEYTPWRDQRPFPGGTAYNCMETEVETRKAESRFGDLVSAEIMDDECDKKRCIICEVETPTLKLSVRGLCKLSFFDEIYLFNIDLDGKLLLLGEYNSYLYFNVDEKLWIWRDRKFNTSQATRIAPEDSLLIGVHEVDFSDVLDNKCEGPKKKMIKFTTCTSGQFTCNDGQCIDIERRCDQTPNCNDRSDEVHCKMLEIDENYSKKIAPFVFESEKNMIIPVTVNISLGLKKILKIEEVHHTFTLKFRLIMEWFDYRISYHNLKHARSSNALSSDEVDRLWIPLVIYENTEHNEGTKATDDTEVTITREGTFHESEKDNVDEINIFSGRDNRITYHQLFTKIFECEYQLQLYPFDTQTCFVNLEVRELERNVVKIHPLSYWNEGPTLLTQYLITDLDLVFKNQSKLKNFKIQQLY